AGGCGGERGGWGGGGGGCQAVGLITARLAVGGPPRRDPPPRVGDRLFGNTGLKRPDGWIRVHGSSAGAHDRYPFSRSETRPIISRADSAHSASEMTGFPFLTTYVASSALPLPTSRTARTAPAGAVRTSLALPVLGGR